MMRAGKDYGVEVVVAYENKRVGQVMFPPNLLRDRLLKSGFVRSRTVQDEQPKPNQSKPTLKLR